MDQQLHQQYQRNVAVVAAANLQNQRQNTAGLAQRRVSKEMGVGLPVMTTLKELFGDKIERYELDGIFDPNQLLGYFSLKRIYSTLLQGIMKSDESQCNIVLDVIELGWRKEAMNRRMYTKSL